jgi:hypothetical protein
MVRLSTYVTAITALLCHSVRAQVAVRDSSVADTTAVLSSEVWAGYSANSTSAGFLGRHGGISLGLIGMRWNHRVRKSATSSLDYTFDLIPIARVTPIIVYPNNVTSRCQPPKYDCVRAAVSAHGAGFSPLGWTFVYHADRALQWRLGANGGVLIFNRPAPSDLAARFNFTAAIEAGMQLMSRNGSGVLVVYRLHHLSNGGQAADNLAILSHVVSIGARWRLRR